MIDHAEIRARARRLGLDASYVENDYALCHLLVAICEGLPELVFRGGTALARIYWPDFRLSEDLDFTSQGPISDLEVRLQNAIRVARERTTLSLELAYGPPRESWSRSTVRWAAHELLLDVNMDVTVAMGKTEGKVDLPYKDLQEIEVITPVFTLTEMLGNKWYMLNDRAEPRDLFDVWSGLTEFDVAFEEIERGHRARYGYAPSPGSIYNAKRLEAPWESRLAHQLADLPPFNQVYRDVKRHFDEWQDRRNAG
ncbi:MAG: nucleotidyl transferase AbiEii/AbiGii toxin family protein [Actinomycetota bacterium]